MKQTLCILEVVSPEWPDFVLTTDIPHSETNVLVFYCFNIKTYKPEEHVMKSTQEG